MRQNEMTDRDRELFLDVLSGSFHIISLRAMNWDCFDECETPAPKQIVNNRMFVYPGTVRPREEWICRVPDILECFRFVFPLEVSRLGLAEHEVISLSNLGPVCFVY